MMALMMTSEGSTANPSKAAGTKRSAHKPGHLSVHVTAQSGAKYSFHQGFSRL
jgi:hypothetical protein